MQSVINNNSHCLTHLSCSVSACRGNIDQDCHKLAIKLKRTAVELVLHCRQGESWQKVFVHQNHPRPDSFDPSAYFHRLSRCFLSHSHLRREQDLLFSDVHIRLSCLRGLLCCSTESINHTHTVHSFSVPGRLLPSNQVRNSCSDFFLFLLKTEQVEFKYSKYPIFLWHSPNC